MNGFDLISCYQATDLRKRKRTAFTEMLQSTIDIPHFTTIDVIKGTINKNAIKTAAINATKCYCPLKTLFYKSKKM